MLRTKTSEVGDTLSLSNLVHYSPNGRAVRVMTMLAKLYLH